MADLLAVTRWVLEFECEAGAGSTGAQEAPKSSRKLLDESVSLRKRRKEEDLARRKLFLSAGWLVSRPQAGFRAFLGLILVCPVKPAGYGDRRRSSSVSVGGCLKRWSISWRSYRLVLC